MINEKLMEELKKEIEEQQTRYNNVDAAELECRRQYNYFTKEKAESRLILETLNRTVILLEEIEGCNNDKI